MTRARRVCRALSDAAGLDPRLLDDTLLDAAIRRRGLATGTPDTERYGALLEREPDEREKLLEELLVRESWFFRDGAPFELLRELAATEWSSARRTSPIRILSAPCACGEEPYSVALALAGSGIGNFRIDAVDLSRSALEIARRGHYRPRVLKQVPPEIAKRFLSSAGHGEFAIDPALRATISWYRANLMDLPATIAGQRYQAILGRNVLIYLHAAARERVLQQFEEMLAPDGVLVVGHAEAGLLAGRGLEPTGSGAAFAFRRRQRRTPRPAVSDPTLPRVAPRRRAAGSPGKSMQPAAENARLDGSLAAIRELADKGTYAEAGTRVQAFIGGNPTSVDAHHLLGLIRAVQGNHEAARRAFERAIYLDPRHGPSLEHLALLLEGAGDAAAAGRLRQRAKRAGGGAC